ncbi:hypothetical protein K435DRAFT_673740 [Dendrothele bispora CBS 962.96]|uniref:GH16 domain-containing protein n=1 Tax=Dendrothele bispora (strain CBS 962.96) TaxID=1314807 RepID=A0A4S8LRY3_DENBC|nr:hypothetical protein K435DRAFT_673740 [Dendrothele bispora CBS 962.96]
MLLLRPQLPLCLTLLLIDATSAENLASRAVEHVHRVATHHTKGLARDLRVAFGAVVLGKRQSQQQAPLGLSNRVVYCKANGTVSAGSNVGSGSGSNSDGTQSGNDGGSGTATGSAAQPSGTSTGAVSTPWKLAESHSGNDFFDGWSFFTASDPTNGIVDYVDENTGRNHNLLEVNSDGNVIMRVDTTQNIGNNNRESVRITTNSHYDQGMFILDAVHMPTGCGSWPAWWTNGPNWPAGGEIDIIEGVNDYTNNQATIHTNPGCTITSDKSNLLGITGNVIGGTNCAAAETNNQGCGIRSSSSVSYGAAFNGNGGGVYAMTLNSTGVAIYFFPRGSVPKDIDAGTPLPALWGQPMAMWGASGCDPSKFFSQQSMIFDTTFCGDWAGGVWGASGIPGQESSCATRTGFSTCEDYVRQNGNAFNEAYWEVKSVKVYTHS